MNSNNLKHYKKSMIDEYENKIIFNDENDAEENEDDDDDDDVMSSANNKTKNVYCICKSSDTQRFMIGCDNCDDWYHGDCVGVSESFTKNIKTFYCHLCRFKNPHLKIKYKKKLTESEIREKYRKEIAKRDAKESELLKKLGLIKDTDTSKNQINNKLITQSVKIKEQNLNQHKSSTNITNVNNNESNLESKLSTNNNNNYNSSNLQLIKNSISKEDIEHFVSAIVQFGTENSSGSSLLSNANLNLLNANISNLTSPLISSTTSSSSSSSSSTTTTTTATTLTTSATSTLIQNQKSLSPSSTTSSSLKKLSNSPQIKHQQQLLSDDIHNQTSLKRQLIKDDKIKDPVYRPTDDEDDNDNDDSTNYEPIVKKKRGRKKKIQNPIELEININNNNNNNNNIKKSNNKSKQSINNEQQQQQQQQNHKRHHHHRHRHHSGQNSDDNANNNDSSNNVKQCLGPGCVEVSRGGSKYCSDECGLKLAKKRLVYFLNEKSDSNELINNETTADVLNENQIKKIDDEIESIKKRLNEIEEEHVKLDGIIEKAKGKKINEKIEIDKDAEETEIYCVTCGHSCNEKHALKHMEKCFNKLESQAFFGSIYKSHPEGQTIFCDYYNAQTKMYCKRLRAMCPEHEKEKKINEDEVCGCPLFKKNNILEDSNDLCLASKRNCQLHFKWEKLRRAQFDLEKLRLWMKLDELYEQKRMIEVSIKNRNGFLSILMHKTINHSDL